MKIKDNILKDFDQIVVEHKYFMDAVTPVLSHIQHGSRGRMLMLVGPTGVGKTTLIKFSIEKLNQFVDDNPELGYSKPVVLEARSPEVGSFSWSGFYFEALEALNEPGIYVKGDLDNSVALLREGKVPPQFRGLTTHKLRSLFEQAISMRKPIAVFIDEIQHLAKCKTRSRVTDNLDVVKSLSNTCQTSFVLTGTYEARQMMYNGGQLSRRVNVAHFRRYSDDKEGFKIFYQIFMSIINVLDLPTEKDLENNMQYFYNHSLGCVGILATWIRTAVELLISTKCKTLTLKHFHKSRLTNLQLSSILREIQAFELEHNNVQDFDPYACLYVGASDHISVSGRNKRQGNIKPGKRNPVRDQIGDMC